MSAGEKSLSVLQFEKEKLKEAERTRRDKETRLVSLNQDLNTEEEMIALAEAKKRSEKKKAHEVLKEEVEKHEMQRAQTEMKQRNETMQVVKDHEMEFEKEVEQTHRAKAQEEAAKGKRWEEERINEDLEMQEAIKARNDLLKQKLVDLGKARDKADAKARLIEAAKIEEKKAFQEKNIEEIAIDKLLEEEQHKRNERAQRNKLLVLKEQETTELRLQSEIGALELEKEKRTKVSELQGAEFTRYEQEIKEGVDIRARKEAEKIEILTKQIEAEKKTFDIQLERQKLRDQEKEMKKHQIAQESENFVAMQADKRKALQNDKKEVEELVKLHDENLKLEEDLKLTRAKERIEQEKQRREEETKSHEADLLKLLEAQKQSKKESHCSDYDDIEQDEERLRLEGLKRRQQQQQQIMDEQDAELELMMKSRKDRDAKQAEPCNDTKSKKKGIFSSLFGRR